MDRAIIHADGTKTFVIGKLALSRGIALSYLNEQGTPDADYYLNQLVARQALQRGDPAVYRVGTRHEEIVVSDRAHCPVCGPVEGSNPDPEFHADHYLPEEAP
jgi:hypothetical protein